MKPTFKCRLTRTEKRAVKMTQLAFLAMKRSPECSSRLTYFLGWKHAMQAMISNLHFSRKIEKGDAIMRRLYRALK